MKLNASRNHQERAESLRWLLFTDKIEFFFFLCGNGENGMAGRFLFFILTPSKPEIRYPCPIYRPERIELDIGSQVSNWVPDPNSSNQLTTKQGLKK